MKSPLPFIAAALLFAVDPLRADFVLRPNDVLAFCGDSATQQKIYTVYLEDYLLMCQPVKGLRFVQLGNGNDKVADFLSSVESDVLPFKPTVITANFGMSDGYLRPMTPVLSQTYRDTTQKMITEFKVDGVRHLVLGSPDCVDSRTFKRNSPDAVNQMLDALGDIAQDLARKNGLLFADVHKPMMNVMSKAEAAYGDKYAFIGGEGFAPGPAGHLVMAYAYLKALGCDGAIGAITVDFGSDQATGTPGQKVVSFENGTVTLESTRYPFCFQGDPNKPADTMASVLRFFPFNDDLNRYMLVVKGIKSPKARVTWGATSKDFAAADLEKGINLAAEFETNPFSGQFSKVDAAVQAQQAHETTLVLKFLHNMANLETMIPAESDSFDKMAAGGMKQDTILFNAAQALVVPIRQTIKIESEP